ncbi:MAG: hypothetical protein FWD48_09540 [Oscillospiraceae bacterium]|nr:hypothetical protein [Oscillospiraceae bacterium]
MAKNTPDEAVKTKIAKRDTLEIVLNNQKNTSQTTEARRTRDPEGARKLIEDWKNKMREDLLETKKTLAEHQSQIQRFDDMISGKTEPDAPMESMIRMRDYLINEKERYLNQKSDYLNGSVLLSMFYIRIASWFELDCPADSMFISDFNNPEERKNYLSFSPETILEDIEKALHNVNNEKYWYRK